MKVLGYEHMGRVDLRVLEAMLAVYDPQRRLTAFKVSRHLSMLLLALVSSA